MNERRQATALYRAFLARFFENEMSEGSRDMKSSFLWIVGMLAAPGMLIPMSNLWRWNDLLSQGPEVFRRGIIADKVVYLSFSMAGVMLLGAVVWQALLVDRRDAIVLGSFPVKGRVIVLSKIASLLAYLGIVAGGMHVMAALMYSTFLATSFREFFLGILGHFISGALACMFAGLAVAALQATILAVGGPRLFARVTAPAQLLLACAGLLFFLFFPLFAAAALDFVRGNDRSAWILWMPQMWFLGIYELMVGAPQRAMGEMAVRAGLALAATLALLLVMYPLAYRRVVRAALQGSPIGRRASLATKIGRRVMAIMSGPADTRGAAHFILLTFGRVARQKLVVATALGAGLALTLPFILRWSRSDWVPPVPSIAQISVPFVFVVFGLIGLRSAYSIPSELPAGWIFSTAMRPYRVGVRAARAVNIALGAALPAFIALPIYAWFWNPVMALQCAFAIFGLGLFVGELLLRGIEHVPFTRAYNPDRARLQARWPLYLIFGTILLQFLPWATRQFIVEGQGFVPGALLILAAFGIRLWRARRPDPPLLLDADLEDKPLALRLY